MPKGRGTEIRPIRNGVVQSLILLVIDVFSLTNRGARVSNWQQHKERVCMADEKVASLEVIKPRRRIELRDLALAAFYPQTRSTTPLPASPPANVAKPWKKPWEK
jgi:hypothetical protein